MKKNILVILLCSFFFPGFSQTLSNITEDNDTVFYQTPVFTPTVYDSSRASGYYFFYAKSKEMLELLVLDKYGNIVYIKLLPHNSIFNMIGDNRILIVTGYKDVIMDSAFHIVDTMECKNKVQIDNHDEQLLPNGHLLLLGHEPFILDLKKHPELKMNRRSDTLTVEAAVIQEQDSAGNVVFEWHAKEHFAFEDVDTFFFNAGDQHIWTHSNALVMDTDGNILLSSRNFSEITKINHSNGNIIWRWGGHHNEFKFVNCPEPFYGQHNIRRIANGHFTLFDNGEYVVSHGARALEFDLDEINKVATLKWSYMYDVDMTSNGQGNVQRLANSNTLVNFGRNSCDSVCFVVVDSTGSKIFQLDGLKTYRAINLPSLPWQLHQPQIISKDSAGITYLEAEKGHDSYYWNNGSRGRVIKANSTDTYYVFVPYGDGAYVSSKKIVTMNVGDKKSKKRKSPFPK